MTRDDSISLRRADVSVDQTEEPKQAADRRSDEGDDIMSSWPPKVVPKPVPCAAVDRVGLRALHVLPAGADRLLHGQPAEQKGVD